MTSSLAAAGVHVDAVEADLAAERLHLVLVPTVGTAEDVLDAADLIADALGVPDVNCSSDGTRVHVWAVVGTTTKTRQVAVWVPVAVRDAVNQIRADHGETVTTVVLSAFNRQAGEDGSGLAELFPGAAAAAPGPMSIVTRKKRANLDTPVQLWMYLHASQEVVLDQAVAATGAGSRSALITRILEADLDLPSSS